MDIGLKVADFLGVSVRWLVTGEDEGELTAEQREVLAKYEYVDDNIKEIVRNALDTGVRQREASQVGESNLDAS